MMITSTTTLLPTPRRKPLQSRGSFVDFIFVFHLRGFVVERNYLSSGLGVQYKLKMWAFFFSLHLIIELRIFSNHKISCFHNSHLSREGNVLVGVVCLMQVV